jgi:hypothetical protein
LINTKNLEPILSYRSDNEHTNIFSIPNHSFEPIFNHLTAETIVDLFTSMIEERPIFIVMEDIKESALIIQGMLSMLQPLEWSFTIVPHIPPSLSNIVSAPFACIIGISSDIWEA